MGEPGAARYIYGDRIIVFYPSPMELHLALVNDAQNDILSLEQVTSRSDGLFD